MRNELGLLTPEEVAEMTGLALSTLATWRSRSVGPSYLKLGRKPYYREQDLHAWISGRVEVTNTEHRGAKRKVVLSPLGLGPRVVQGHRLGRHQKQKGRRAAETGRSSQAGETGSGRRTGPA